MDDLTSRENGNQPPEDLRHVRLARDAVLAHLLSKGEWTFADIELLDSLGRACGDGDVLTQLAFLARARLTRRLELIALVRRSRTLDAQEAERC